VGILEISEAAWFKPDRILIDQNMDWKWKDEHHKVLIHVTTGDEYLLRKTDDGHTLQLIQPKSETK